MSVKGLFLFSFKYREMNVSVDLILGISGGVAIFKCLLKCCTESNFEERYNIDKKIEG